MDRINDRLSVAMPRGPNFKAIEDAKKTQAVIAAQCAEAGRPLPPYHLSELIGKGSFGRVYKAVDTRQPAAQMVAVKIINIEEGDVQSPGGPVDTIGDILKEVNTLKLLSAGGARNVNVVLDSLLVGPAVWIVTELCAGGSVATLMRPTGFLIEKWIIPILREVAEALFWVHRQGIIHRDIKCANVLVTATGGVQLCDFGVAGIVESKFDKRKTVTGTLHWMAPELFQAGVAYGAEVDIWAFGSMAYEVASGLPPNATMHIDPGSFGSYLGQHSPRLEGDRYSEQLKDLVAFCLVPDPAQRPSIEQIQRHPYLYGTASRYPVESLRTLLSAFQVWQARGGGRLSLFSAGGAQGLGMGGPDGGGLMQQQQQHRSPDWDFGDDDDGDDDDDDYDNDGYADDVNTMFQPDGTPDAKAVYEAYGLPFEDAQQQRDATLQASRAAPPPPPPPPSAPPSTASSSTNLRRRRMPPPGMPRRQYPLEKLFDSGTLTSYPEMARAVYGRNNEPPTSAPSDLPLRERDAHDDDASRTVRESLIDLDASLVPDNEPTIRAARRRSSITIDDLGPRRRTQDWSFPTAPLSAAAADDMPHDWPLVSSDESGQYDQQQQQLLRDRRKTQDWTFPEIRLPPSDPLPPPPPPAPANVADTTRRVGSRPNLTTAASASAIMSSSSSSSSTAAAAAANRQSTVSLIDLDESIVDPDAHDYLAPASASSSFATSIATTEDNDAASESEDPPFGLERLRLGQLRRRQPSTASSTRFGSIDYGGGSISGGRREREPSLYIPDDYGGGSSSREREPSLYVSDDYGSGGGGGREPSLYVPDGLGFPIIDPKATEPAAAAAPAAQSAPAPASASTSTPVPAPLQIQPRALHTSADVATSQAGGDAASASASATATALALPPTPRAPSSKVLGGRAGRETIRDELLRLLGSLGDHLQMAGHSMERLPTRAPG